MIRAALRDLLKRKRGRIWCLLPCKVHILPPVPCLLSKNSSPSPIRQAGAGSGLEAAGLEAAGPEQRGNNRRRCERGQSVHEPAAADKQYVHAVKTLADALWCFDVLFKRRERLDINLIICFLTEPPGQLSSSVGGWVAFMVHFARRAD